MEAGDNPAQAELQDYETVNLMTVHASKGLELCEKAFLENGDDDTLMTASYMGGVSIVNSEVGVCHALSYGLSLELGYRHGLANCVAFNVLEALLPAGSRKGLSAP